MHQEVEKVHSFAVATFRKLFVKSNQKTLQIFPFSVTQQREIPSTELEVLSEANCGIVHS